MRVAVYSDGLGNLGGAEKYGLLLVAPLAGRHDVTVYHRSPQADYPAILRERFAVDLGAARFEFCRSEREVARRMRGADVAVNITDASLLPNPGRVGVLCVFFPIPLDDYPVQADSPPARLAERARQEVLGRVADWSPSLAAGGVGFRQYARRHGAAAAAARLPLFALRSAAWLGYRDRRYGRAAVRSYQRVVACSAFGAEWIERYYGVPAEVVYPPIDTHLFRPGPKRKEVVAVGRFDDSEKSKKFHVVIDAFKRLHDAGSLTGWELHCCGGLHGPRTEAYLARLRGQAAGYPVHFHANLPLAALADRYAAASQFWHAMGYGEDVERHPWRFEHFGMTTVEAMAAGCVPVVIDAGGQPEIVTDPAHGSRWRTLDGFAAEVRRLAAMPADEFAAMGRAARRRAEHFSRQNFLQAAAELFTALGVPNG